MEQILNNRVRKLNNILNKEGNSVFYIMSRDQRVDDNYALFSAYKEAKEKNVRLIIIFNLYPKVKNRIFQQYDFMLNGLKKVQYELNKLNIDFILTIGKANENFSVLITKYKPTSIFFDFSPLKGSKKIKSKLASYADIPCFEVDTHNIVPVWITSDKEEFAAHTIRTKIYAHLKNYLIEPEKLQQLNNILFISENNKKIFINPNLQEWDEIFNKVEAPKIEGYKVEFKSGKDEAIYRLNSFIHNKLLNYNHDRNLPEIDGQSNLSPYLHFGQISSLRVVLEINNFLKQNPQLDQTLANSFLEEIIVRKELTDNFCNYNHDYDSFNGLKPWAKNTLIKHLKDKREFLYTLEELEFAKTHDDAWNSAQLQLIRKGKIHGYMRMYWAKKILEWTDHPKNAIQWCIFLNDKYHLDGYDPNGYVGILWSMGGIHDRPWFEREIFGQIRYMNYNGLKRKFNLLKYISSIASI